MDRQGQWTVNITGDEWQVVLVPALESVYARKEGRELMASLGVSGSDELFYRACIARRSIMQGGRPVFKSGEEVLNTLTEREIFSITDESVRSADEDAAEKAEEKRKISDEDAPENLSARVKAEYVPAAAEKTKAESAAQWIQWEGAPELGRRGDGARAAGTYRDAVNALSRYLERDSRRFDG